MGIAHPLHDFRDFRKRLPPDQRRRETLKIAGICSVLLLGAFLVVVGAYAGLARLIEPSPVEVAKEAAREEIGALSVSKHRVLIKTDGQLGPGRYEVIVEPADEGYDAVWRVRRVGPR